MTSKSSSMNMGEAAPSCPYSQGDWIVGKYLLEEMIGTGGMCTVWVATDTGLDRKVALKFLRSDLPRREADRLLREARAAARVEHPAIIRVFDYGETEENHPFIAMELLDGESMADTLFRDGPLSPIYACRLLLPIIDGLSAAHDRGIVHRDLKPENVFLVSEGGRTQPKLLDFGIAKFTTRDPKPSLTLNGAVLGSPSYMAPEQARGLSDVDQRSDIWAACMVIYESVTGAVPFRGDNYNAILRSIIEDDVPPITEHGRGEAALWAVLCRGLVKNRERRYQSMHELGEGLSAFLLARGVDTDVSGAPLVPVWKRRKGATRRKFPIATVSHDSLPGKGGTLKVPPQTADFARGWTRAHATTHVARKSHPVRTLPALAALIAGGALAFAIPSSVVRSPMVDRAAMGRIESTVLDRAIALSHLAERAGRVGDPAPGSNGEPLAAGTEPDVRGPPATAPVPSGADSKTSQWAHSPPRKPRPSSKSTENASVSTDSENDARARNETLRALGLKAPY